MRRPLVIFAIIFCSGISVASAVKASFSIIFFLSTAFLLAAALSTKRDLVFDICLSLLIFSLGMGHLVNYKILPNSHIIHSFIYRDKELYCIKGTVFSQPQIRTNRTSFVFRTSRGDIKAFVKSGVNLHYGDTLVLKGGLCRPPAFGSSKRNNYRNYLQGQGIYALMNVPDKTAIIYLDHNKAVSLTKFSYKLKDAIENTIYKYLPGLAASILDAMLLGERRNLPALINNSMIKSGTVHILVVSGFNVGIVAFILVLFLKLLRFPRKMRLCLSISCLVVYCIMTGASPPVLRATVMAIVFLLSYHIKREPDIYYSLGIAAIFILAFNPLQLFEIGFQLSFVSVISIVYLYPKVKSLLRLENLKPAFLRFFLDGLLVSFSAWIGTMGFIAYYFRIFSPVTVLANVFIVPLATLISLSGIILVFSGLIAPGFAPVFAYSCETAIVILLKINAVLIKLPFACINLH
jgi:competence protein ComEC